MFHGACPDSAAIARTGEAEGPQRRLGEGETAVIYVGEVSSL